MKTLANPTDKHEILNRLQAVKPGSERRWGRMSAHQMICHLSDAFRSCMGERRVSNLPRWIPRSPFRWAALWLPVRWPRGIRGPREWDPNGGGTPPAEFENDLDELRRLIERFTQRPRDFEQVCHPFFGRMSDKEWLRLGYLHLDHHLRQFGA